ncbi:bifunctional heptose 7-phosphate kinase/heptose 1-phosphate adenyltransferase [Fundidesulfovibrio terrae]|uniref:bifunctional heptose 7-phosphate kinase/heptose 1-phosphate adenyltransferase n=1 Tax=Fundidesulfovibrio terrae TaxID=2922866 RepID=UPI001FAF926B|nr:bifunctional ADP-heptose synthase [Fundidesulfovibrio terrae]
MPSDPPGRNFADAVERLAGVPVLVVGDVMLDHYLAGDAERISPEAPIPVVRVASEKHLLGGAGNVARNIAALGGKPELVSVIGADDPGSVLQELLSKEGLPGHLVVEKRRMTTIKTRIIARNQQMLRVDREESRELEGGSLDALDGLLRSVARRHGVVVVSDYGKGVVCAKLMDTLRGLEAEGGKAPLILVDPKTVNASLYAHADLLTPNAKEAGELAGVKASGRDGVIKAGLAIFKRLRCRQLCITLGAEGMAVFERPGRVLHVPTVARNVYDVTGAGDTVMAVLAMALGAGYDLPRASVLANYAAGIVVGQVGAAVASPEALREAIRSVEPPRVETWLDIE